MCWVISQKGEYTHAVVVVIVKERKCLGPDIAHASIVTA